MPEIALQSMQCFPVCEFLDLRNPIADLRDLQQDLALSLVLYPSVQTIRRTELRVQCQTIQITKRVTQFQIFLFQVFHSIRHIELNRSALRSRSIRSLRLAWISISAVLGIIFPRLLVSMFGQKFGQKFKRCLTDSISMFRWKLIAKCSPSASLLFNGITKEFIDNLLKQKKATAEGQSILATLSNIGFPNQRDNHKFFGYP